MSSNLGQSIYLFDCLYVCPSFQIGTIEQSHKNRWRPCRATNTGAGRRPLIVRIRQVLGHIDFLADQLKHTATSDYSHVRSTCIRPHSGRGRGGGRHVKSGPQDQAGRFGRTDGRAGSASRSSWRSSVLTVYIHTYGAPRPFPGRFKPHMPCRPTGLWEDATRCSPERAGRRTRVWQFGMYVGTSLSVRVGWSERMRIRLTVTSPWMRCWGWGMMWLCLTRSS